tara:strand:+ start:19373 stop:20113 length:741 start_codon:yes stop_codon:yes gene_type:complete
MERSSGKEKKLIFDEENHKYYVGNEEYISVTTLIHSYFNKFDMQEVSKRYAEKNGLDQDEVIEMWKKNGERASEFGNKIHFWGEELLKGKEVRIPEEDPIDDYDRKAPKYLKIMKKYIEQRFKEKYELIDVEKRVFSEEYKVAGTIDILAKDKKTGEIVIMDWKTNKSLKFENRFQRGKGPLYKMDDCNYNHYRLQLNIYKEILKNYYQGENFQMKIVHIMEDSIKTYNVKELPEAKEILKRGKNG